MKPRLDRRPEVLDALVEWIVEPLEWKHDGLHETLDRLACFADILPVEDREVLASLIAPIVAAKRSDPGSKCYTEIIGGPRDPRRVPRRQVDLRPTTVTGPADARRHVREVLGLLFVPTRQEGGQG